VRPAPRPFHGYAFAAASVGLAFLLTRVFERALEGHVSPLFFAAVTASAWYGGLGPGLVATALAAVATGGKPDGRK
jgi:hypothetical protein